LSSRHSRFSWGKQDRASSTPFFRSLASQWRPTVRKRPPPPEQTVTTDTKSAGDKTARPVWTPWLWVD
jgi:hypothetical protein